MKTQLYTLFSSSPNEARPQRNSASLATRGAYDLHPTDTVYAMGCLSNSEKGLNKLAALKDIRLEKAPLSFLFEDLSSLSNYVKPFDAATFRLLKRCLPGPYAFVMEAVKEAPQAISKT